MRRGGREPDTPKRTTSSRHPGQSLEFQSKLVSLSDKSSLQSVDVEQQNACAGRITALSAESFDDRTLPL